MKRCIICGEVKPLSEFHKQASSGDGRHPHCKACRAKNDRKKYNENKEEILARNRAYRKTENGKLSSKSSERKRAGKHPDRKRARAILYRAVKSGKVTKLPCEKCNVTEKVEGHHPDYSKPLEVIWLCKAHHILEHKGEEFENA